MLRRFFYTVLGTIGILGIAYAAQIPLLNGPNYSDPSQILGTTNAVIQAVNNGVSGQVAQIPAPVATTGTALNTILAATLAAGKLTTGQVLHYRTWGSNDSNADVRTVTFSFGGSTDAIVVTSTSHNWLCDFYVSQQAPAVEAETGVCNVNGTGTAPTANAWTVASTSPIATLLEGTAATTGAMTFDAAYAEVLR